MKPMTFRETLQAELKRLEAIERVRRTTREAWLVLLPLEYRIALCNHVREVHSDGRAGNVE